MSCIIRKNAPMTQISYLPRDLVRKILNLYNDFQIQAAIQRTAEFRSKFGIGWASIMSDIRMNVPAYRVSVVNYDGLHMNLYFRLPDCDVSNFEFRALFNSWEYSLERSALGLPRGLFYLHE